jgi:hypothetical protein
MKFPYKLECLSLASFYSLVKCLSIRHGDYPRMEHLKSATRVGSSISSKHRLGWKSLPGTNTLANHEKL